MGVWSGRVLPFPASYIWSFSIPQSMSFRRSLRRLAAVLAFGASSIFWKATAMIIRAQMLMYGREAQSKTSQGMKQLMAGGGVATIGLILVPLLKGLFG